MRSTIPDLTPIKSLFWRFLENIYPTIHPPPISHNPITLPTTPRTAHYPTHSIPLHLDDLFSATPLSK